jgi:hypothetical protein
MQVEVSDACLSAFQMRDPMTRTDSDADQKTVQEIQASLLCPFHCFNPRSAFAVARAATVAVEVEVEVAFEVEPR